MGFNVFLAALGVGAGFLFSRVKNKLLKTSTFLIWLLFIPNTIYLVTDLQYLTSQSVKVEMGLQILLLIQYLVLAVLGVVTYIAGIRPIEKVLLKSKFWKGKAMVVILFLNLLISFAVVLGKIYRAHSWYVISNPLPVIDGSLKILNSSQLLIVCLLFAIVTNLTYFLFRKYLPNNLLFQK